MRRGEKAGEGLPEGLAPLSQIFVGKEIRYSLSNNPHLFHHANHISAFLKSLAWDLWGLPDMGVEILAGCIKFVCLFGSQDEVLKHIKKFWVGLELCQGYSMCADGRGLEERDAVQVKDITLNGE